MDKQQIRKKWFFAINGQEFCGFFTAEELRAGEYRGPFRSLKEAKMEARKRYLYDLKMAKQALKEIRDFKSKKG